MPDPNWGVGGERKLINLGLFLVLIIISTALLKPTGINKLLNDLFSRDDGPNSEPVPHRTGS